MESSNLKTAHNMKNVNKTSRNWDKGYEVDTASAAARAREAAVMVAEKLRALNLTLTQVEHVTLHATNGYFKKV